MLGTQHSGPNLGRVTHDRPRTAASARSRIPADAPCTGSPLLVLGMIDTGSLRTRTRRGRQPDATHHERKNPVIYTIEDFKDPLRNKELQTELETRLRRSALVQSHELSEMFGLTGRASQFVVKAVVLWAIYSAGSEFADRLLAHLEDHSWGSFDYSAVSSEISVEDTARTVSDQVFTMLAAISGEA